MLQNLGFVADIAIMVGYFLVQRNTKYVRLYAWINVFAGFVLIPLEAKVTQALILGVFFVVISVYGLLRSR